MSISELIAECEKIDKEASPGPWLHRSVEGGWDGVASERDLEICRLSYNHPENATIIARSRTLLPLLVAVIKNQQRQIEIAILALENLEDPVLSDTISTTAEDALTEIIALGCQLEDVNP